MSCSKATSQFALLLAESRLRRDAAAPWKQLLAAEIVMQYRRFQGAESNSCPSDVFVLAGLCMLRCSCIHPMRRPGFQENDKAAQENMTRVPGCHWASSCCGACGSCPRRAWPALRRCESACAATEGHIKAAALSDFEVLLKYQQSA